ncbi:MAG: ATP-binding protein [Blastococcus sp.]
MAGSADLRQVSRHVATLLGVLQRLDAGLSAAVQARPGGGPARRLLDPDEHPPDSRFRRIAVAYGLSPVELDLLLLAMAPQLDARYGELYATLQEDLTRLRPTVSMALDLLGLTPAQRLVAASVLGPSSTLVASGLVRLQEPGGSPGCPLPQRELAADERLAAFVTGDDALDPGLLGLAELVAVANDDDLVLADEVRRVLTTLGERPQPLCLLRGPEGSGRQAVAEVLAAGWGVPALLRVPTDRLPLGDRARFAGVVRAVGREALLHGAATYWERFEVLFDDDRGPLRDVVLAELARQPHAIVSASAEWPGAGRPAAAEVVLPPLDAGQRAVLWRRGLDAAGVQGPGDADVAALAGAFRLGPGAIAAAAAEVARTGRTGPGGVPAADIAAAARRQGSSALSHEAERIEQSFGWDDLVLTPDRLQQLRSVADRVRHRALVLDRWGFARTLGPARGTAALFTGPSGTGKTMAAGILAGSLGLELYRVDLAGVVSKYIGETEKNLARVFAAAAATDAVLFFDEADALFGKRTEVRDAHDRYANVEVAYLLQRIEQHDGVVVLATNLRKNIDDAFLRRLQFVVEFPLPDRDHRRQIWQRMFPPAAPVDPALDLDLLADRFELSGGSIRNVAVEAAFSAAADGRPIGADHVWTALRHEHLKLGRVISAEPVAPTPLRRSVG